MKSLKTFAFSLLALGGVTFGAADDAEAASRCTSSEWNRLETNFARSADNAAASHVATRTNGRASLMECAAYQDGYIVFGRYNFQGAVNRETFWIEGRACYDRKGSSCGFEVTNANGALIGDQLGKAFLGALLICALGGCEGS